MRGRAISANLSKVLGTLLVIGISGSTVSYGTFATFTAQSSNTGNTFSTGTLALTTLPASGTAILSLGNMKPGDSIARGVTVENSGSINASLTLSTSTVAPTLLTSDATHGLKLLVEKCVTAFGGTTPETCTGGSAVSIPTQTVIGTNMALPALNAGAANKHYYLVTVSLPSTAGNTFQGLTQTVAFTWDATQVAGTAQ